ncbi:MAG: hypothetical protein K2H86_03385, partial [Muribaculaceae bacterium]|nr:hypothetical protein [Muribaculaceae bacterium]
MKHITLPLLLTVCSMMAPGSSSAANRSKAHTNKTVTESGVYIFPRTEAPENIEMFSATAYTTGLHQLQTLSGHELFLFNDTIRNMAVNPTGINIAVVHDKKNKAQIDIINTVNGTKGAKGFKYNAKELGRPVSSCYLDDGRMLAIATDKVIYLFETKQYTIAGKIENPGLTPR